ncbi:unnamed protein product [Sphagnum jensenii]|uniref:Uncharacterized protein n=1 Tax=Sphagnum jensenii TaxID=128206 RepID=A0ABP1A9A5_9BRYO
MIIIKAASSCLLLFLTPVQPFFSLRRRIVPVCAVPCRREIFFPKDRSPGTANLTRYGHYNAVATTVKKPTSFKLCHSQNISSDARSQESLALRAFCLGFFLQSCLCEAQAQSVERNDAASTGPVVLPQPRLTAEEAVKLQMDALACNNEPRPDHGLEVMYHFANAEGTLNGGSLSCYFGFASDLYHFGHFALKFKTRYPLLIDHQGYKIVSRKESVQGRGDDEALVSVSEIRLEVKGKDKGTTSGWVFHLSKCTRGRLPACWLTNSLLKDELISLP